MLPMLISGARGEISYTDASGTTRVLATALDINVSVADGQQQTFVVGSYNAAAIDPTGTDVSGSVSRVIPVNSGAAPTGGGKSTPITNLSDIDLGLQQRIQQILSSEAVTLTLTDKVTDKVVASVRECRFAGSGLNLAAQGLANKRISFVGIWDGGYNGNSNVASLLGYQSSNA